MLLALSLQSCVISDLSNRFDPKNGGFVLGDFLGSSGGGGSGGCVFDGGNFDSCNFSS